MQRYRPYIIAAILAFIMTSMIAPEIQEGDAMNPVLSDGDMVVLMKDTYSENRGMPEIGDFVVLEKSAFGEDYYEDNPIRKVSGLPGDKVIMGDGSEVIIEKNQVFVTSENYEGLDSRNVTVGPIASDMIKGKVIIRLWPFDKIGGIK